MIEGNPTRHAIVVPCCLKPIISNQMRLWRHCLRSLAAYSNEQKWSFPNATPRTVVPLSWAERKRLHISSILWNAAQPVEVYTLYRASPWAAMVFIKRMHILSITARMGNRSSEHQCLLCRMSRVLDKAACTGFNAAMFFCAISSVNSTSQISPSSPFVYLYGGHALYINWLSRVFLAHFQPQKKKMSSNIWHIVVALFCSSTPISTVTVSPCVAWS